MIVKIVEELKQNVPGKGLHLTYYSLIIIFMMSSAPYQGYAYWFTDPVFKCPISNNNKNNINNNINNNNNNNMIENNNSNNNIKNNNNINNMNDS